MIASYLFSAARLAGTFGLALVLFTPADLAALGSCPGKVAGSVDDFYGKVMMFQAQRSPTGRVVTHDWVQVRERRHPMEISDLIQTGRDGHAVLEFCDFVPAGVVSDNPVGPSVFNLGPATQMAIASFEIDYDRMRKPARRGMLNLIRGTIRSFLKGWGQSSRFSIRAGVVVAGIRDGDATIEYVPEGERLTVTVHEGKAVVAGPKGVRVVERGQTRRFIGGRPEGESPPS